MRKTIFTVTGLLLSCYTVVFGQINTGEEPVSFRSKVPVLTKSEKAMKSFGPLDMKKIEQEDRDREGNKDNIS